MMRNELWKIKPKLQKPQLNADQLEDRLIEFAVRIIKSTADFIHKLGVVLKELNESSIWLRIIDQSQILRKELLTSIIKENRSCARYSRQRSGRLVSAGNDK